MNCSFNNPKSSRFFPRLHDEAGCGECLNCMRNTGGLVFMGLQDEDCGVIKENRLEIPSLF